MPARMLRHASRLLVAATAVAATSAVAIPAASAAGSDSCPSASSTRLVTAQALSGDEGEIRLWLYQPTSGELHVCYVLPAGITEPSVAGEIVVRSGGPLVPEVTRTTSSTPCANVFTVSDPVFLEIRGEFTDTSNPFTICAQSGGEATRITVNTFDPLGAVPSVQVWRDADTWHSFTECLILSTAAIEGMSTCDQNPKRLV